MVENLTFFIFSLFDSIKVFIEVLKFDGFATFN